MVVGQKENPDHRFWSIFPFTNRVFWVPFFDPLPYVGREGMLISVRTGPKPFWR